MGYDGLSWKGSGTRLDGESANDTRYDSVWLRAQYGMQKAIKKSD